MSIAIDIVLVLVLLIFSIRFTRVGFARTVFRIGKTWLSLFTALVMGPIISGRIEAWFLSDKITNGICTTLETTLSTSTTGYNIKALFEQLPSGFVSFLEWFKISIPELEATYGSATEPNHDMLMEISELLAAPLATFASNLFGHIICFLITFFFFKWINLQIRKRRIPFLRYIDHIFGFIVGTSIGCAVVVGGSILARTVFQIILAFNGESNIMSVYDNSYIFKFLGELDVIGIFSQIFS